MALPGTTVGEMVASGVPRDVAINEMNTRVFGQGYRKTRDGRPQEQGIGSKANMTSTSIAAFERWCRDEPNFTQSLAQMKKDLADCVARRAAQATEF
jgi:hypothetical protein